MSITGSLFLDHPHLPRPNGSNGDDPLFSAGYMPARADFHIVRFFVFGLPPSDGKGTMKLPLSVGQ